MSNPSTKTTATYDIFSLHGRKRSSAAVRSRRLLPAPRPPDSLRNTGGHIQLTRVASAPSTPSPQRVAAEPRPRVTWHQSCCAERMHSRAFVIPATLLLSVFLATPAAAQTGRQSAHPRRLVRALPLPTCRHRRQTPSCARIEGRPAPALSGRNVSGRSARQLDRYSGVPPRENVGLRRHRDLGVGSLRW